jgi:hypothetical protein
MKMVDLKEVERTELRKQAYKGVEGKSELSQIMILPFAEETGRLVSPMTVDMTEKGSMMNLVEKLR